MSKHTPGPLFAIGEIGVRGAPLGFKPTIVTKTAHDANEYGCVSVKELEATPQRYLCDVRGPGRDWGVPSEETEANARLIAAAPDMLAALKAVVDLNRGTQTEQDESFRMAYEAIAKAEGR